MIKQIATELGNPFEGGLSSPGDPAPGSANIVKEYVTPDGGRVYVMDDGTKVSVPPPPTSSG